MVELRGSKAPADLLFFAMTLLFCVGISNVAIYVTTRNVGLHSKRSQGVHSTRPAGGTQVEIYVDRVTQNDVGVVTIGGTGLHGRDKSIRFEGDDDLKGTIYQKTEYDGSVRGSLEYSYAEAKSPTSSVSQLSCSANSPCCVHLNYLTDPFRFYKSAGVHLRPSISIYLEESHTGEGQPPQRWEGGRGSCWHPTSEHERGGV